MASPNRMPMPKSHLYGNLEMPGFKGFPSLNSTKLLGSENNLNPDQGVFEIKQALVRPKLSNGRTWNEYKERMPISEVDIFPQVKPPFPLSKATGAFGVDARASNPEMITGFGMLPHYPEEERIKAMLSNPTARRQEESIFKRKIPAKRADVVDVESESKKQETERLQFRQKREKFTADKFSRLAELGFSEETISQVVQEESKRDIMKVLNNPSLMGEADIASAIEETYEKWVTKRNMMKTGENASGIGAASSVQSPGVTAYASAAAFADYSMPPNKTGADRVRAQLRQEEGEARREHNYEGLNENASGGTSLADVLSGMAARVGTGPGGSATNTVAGMEGMVVERKGRGRPKGTPQPESFFQKQKERQATISQFFESKKKGV